MASKNQRNFNHARYKDIASSCNQANVTLKDLISTMSYEVPVDWSMIKHIEKHIIKQLWGLNSTEEMKPTHIVALVNMWSKGLGQNFGIDYDDE